MQLGELVGGVKAVEYGIGGRPGAMPVQGGRETAVTSMLIRSDGLLIDE
ncbi:hypothetical protein [Nonomuraea terrae]|nr:hypothetical protein [Nonomuraea terrae]